MGLRHSLRKTRYSRVKGAARSSLLKPLIVLETCGRCYCYRATNPHTAPTDKKRALRLCTAETGPFAAFLMLIVFCLFYILLYLCSSRM